MKKRNLFLAVALIALMTGVLSAQTYDSESDFQVTKTATEVTITKYVGTKTAVNIPPRIQNLPVTIIGNNAFKDYAKLTSVTIPESVKSIERFVFQNCTGLTSVTIPKSVTAIGNSAFFGCTSLTSVTLPGTIIQAKFGDPVSPPFPGDLRDKFYAGAQLSGWAATYTRPNGTSNTWTRTTPAVAASSGDPESDFEITKTATAVTITGYKGSKTTINIPSRIQNLPVTSIGDQAFQQNSSITSVTIPNSVTSIGDDTFENCISLISVTIPNSVISIGGGAFSFCTSLTSLTIPNSVTKIGDRAFSSTALNSVTFGGTIASANFGTSPFPGDLRTKYLAGGAGTYTKSGTTWTKK